jgi:hypothetical protein
MEVKYPKTLNKLPITFMSLGVFLLPFFAYAAPFSLSPKVIDIKGRVREISHHGITVKNNTEALRNIFVWVVDVDQAKGDLSDKDMSGANQNDVVTSPARWIDIPRSNEVLPKEEQTIPLQIQIPGQAKPGIYHVSVKFASGETQSAAMKCKECTEEVSLNIEVTEDIREKLQLYAFTTAKDVFLNPKADFTFSVENTGNKAVVPNGKIRIFNNIGKEVGLIDVNGEGKQIDPKSKELLAATWAAGGKFGKYKAMLDVSYGQRGTMQDVVYFWVIPWTKLFGFMFTLLLGGIIIMLFIRTRTLAQPAYARSYSEPTPTEKNDELVMTPRLEKKTAFEKKPVRLDDVLLQSKTRTLTEVNLPPRTRTVPPQDFSVALETKKATPTEYHIVRLK